MAGLGLVPLLAPRDTSVSRFGCRLSLRDTQLGDAAPICPCRNQFVPVVRNCEKTILARRLSASANEFGHDISEL